jgi:hypothetical protein
MEVLEGQRLFVADPAHLCDGSGVVPQSRSGKPALTAPEPRALR